MTAASSSPIITVRGEARLEGPPDLASISITVHSSAPDADRVRAELATASGLIREIVQARQESLESSSTSGLHVSPVFRQRGAKITGYQGSFSTSVVLKDLDAISDLVLAAGAVPGAGVDGPWWSLRPDNALYRKARLAAITDARQRAEDYAVAFGGTVGPVLEISDLDGGMGWVAQSRFSAKMDMAMDSEQPAFDFEPARQDVSGQVTVRFALVLSDS